jgi:hypothetical protein
LCSAVCRNKKANSGRPKPHRYTATVTTDLQLDEMRQILMNTVTDNRTAASGELLVSELVICSSFVEIAKQEIDRGEHRLADSIIVRAEEIYAEARPLVASVEDGAEKQRLEWKLIDIRFRLDILESQMKRFVSRSKRHFMMPSAQ